MAIGKAEISPKIDKNYLPDHFWKGVNNPGDLRGNSAVWQVFMAPPSAQPKNGWKYSSINWEFDIGASQHLIDMTKDGRKQFEGGALKVMKSGLDHIIGLYECNDVFDYEHDPLPGGENDYHGNIMFAENIESVDRTTYCAVLSAFVVERREQQE